MTPRKARMISLAYQLSLSIGPGQGGAHRVLDRQAPQQLLTIRPLTMPRPPVSPSVGQLPNRTKDAAYGAGRVIPARPPN